MPDPSVFIIPKPTVPALAAEFKARLTRELGEAEVRRRNAMAAACASLRWDPDWSAQADLDVVNAAWTLALPRGPLLQRRECLEELAEAAREFDEGGSSYRLTAALEALDACELGAAEGWE